MEQTQVHETQTVQFTKTSQPSVTIDLWKALGIVGASILGGLVIGAFAAASTINSDHFILQSTAQAVTEIKSDYVRSDVYNANQTSLNVSLRDIKNQLDTISGRLDNSPSQGTK